MAQLRRLAEDVEVSSPEVTEIVHGYD